MASTQEQQTIPNGLKWTEIRANTQREKLAFIYVYDSDNLTTYRKITGAEKYWKSADPQKSRVIYNEKYAITGTPNDVYAALEPAIGEEAAHAAVKDSISRSNYQTTKAEDYERLKRDTAARSESTSSGDKFIGWKLVRFYGENVNLSVPVVRSSKSGSKVVTHIGSSDALRKRWLTVKDSNVDVIDVSNMDESTFKGFKKLARNKLGGKAATENLNIASNNAKKYVAALVHLFGPNAVTIHAKEIEEIKNKLAEAADPGVYAAPAGSYPVYKKPVMKDAPESPARETVGAAMSSKPSVTRPSVKSPTGVKTTGNRAAGMPSGRHVFKSNK